MPVAEDSIARRYPTALVTGASSGIGKAIADALVAEGVMVYGTTRQTGKENLPENIRWLAFNGSTTEGIDAFIEREGKMLSKINLLVNNAGSSRFGSITELSGKAISEQVQLLLEAPVRLCRAVLPEMQRNGGGIVNISSLAASFPMPYMSVYTAGKAALSGFTRSLILTEQKETFKIWDFQPGDFRTAFNDNQAAEHELSTSEARAWEQVERHLRTAPLPEQAAIDLLKALRRNKGGIVRTGGFFQQHIAPLGERLLPRRLLLWTIRRYYRL